MFSFILTLKRELTLAYHCRMEYLNPLFFFLLITVLFPLAITSDPKELRLMGPGLIWIGLLFANLLAIEQLFSTDFEDGTLELMILHPNSLINFVAGKLLMHWFTTALPLMLTTVFIAKVYYLNFYTIQILFVGLALGSPILTLLCALGTALTLGLKNRGLLLILLIIPLYLPVIIFGAGAANDAAQLLPVASQLYFLAAFLTLSITFIPIAICSAVKIHL